MRNNRKVENQINLKKSTLLKNKVKDRIRIVPSIVTLIILLAILLACFIVFKNNTELIRYSQTKEQLEEEKKANIERIEEIGLKGYISNATIISTKTGTGPFDDNDDPGNDSSEDNNIVRSFDQVMWTIDLTTSIKEGVEENTLTGGIVEIEVTLPEFCSDMMEWDLSSMQWLEEAQVSEDGRTVSGKYIMSETEDTIPGKQTLVFVLQVYGAGNGTEIVPTFNFKLTGNEEKDEVNITGQAVTVSATGKYNIELHNNTNLSNKTTINLENAEIEGRMYGYGFTVQLYNENESKGLKGLEYPKGEISFDINLKLERSILGTDNLEDITDESTPIIWNYRINNWDITDITGNVENRNMWYNENTYTVYDQSLPLGIDQGERYYSTYNSGDIRIEQEEGKLHVTINNYGFDGKFPQYSSAWSGSNMGNKTKIYDDNIGTFSVGYIQIFVPDTEASTMEDRNYYLTISDDNMNVISTSQEIINTQEKTSDDDITIQHIIYKKGTYSQNLYLRDQDEIYGSVESGYGTGDGIVNIGDIITVQTRFTIAQTNDYDINTANRLVKFDGEAFEPIYYEDGNKYKTVGRGNPEFKVWYITKEDGSNWISEQEMNNANIEDMKIYENIEDIPKGNLCVGIYFETISGYISRVDANNNAVKFLLKIKDTAKIGQTYGMTQRTWLWVESLDRSIYTITNPDVEWPDSEYDSGNLQYIKTEYNEIGQMISGTHSGGAVYGNTVFNLGS